MAEANSTWKKASISNEDELSQIKANQKFQHQFKTLEHDNDDDKSATIKEDDLV